MTQVFTGSGRHFQELHSVSLDDENLGEIVQRVKLQPHFLGEPLVIIAEGESFSLPAVNGVKELLALDVLGRCVAVSIVIGSVHNREYVQSRVLDLAAQAGAYTPDELGRICREFLGKPENDNLRRAWDDSGVEINPDSVELASLLAVTFERDAGDYSEFINKSQRVIVAAEDFGRRMINSVNWLSQCGVDIKGIKYRKFLVGGQEVFFAEQSVPQANVSRDTRAAAALPQESIEPWKAKGLAYYLELLTPAVAGKLERMIEQLRESTFSKNWANKYYFWWRGNRRTFRVRVYNRDRLELGFYNASVDMVESFLSGFKLPGVEVYSVGGYSESPFISISSGFDLDGEWLEMMRAWLSGFDKE